MNMNISRNTYHEREYLKGSQIDRQNNYSPNFEFKTTKNNSSGMNKYADKFSNFNESTLSRLEENHLMNLKSGKSADKLNKYTNDNSLYLNFKYEKKSELNLYDERTLLLNENKDLKQQIESYKAQIKEMEDKIMFSNKENKEKLGRLKDKIEFFEEENEKFRIEKSKLINSTNDKLCLLTKLCKKYLKKFKHLALHIKKFQEDETKELPTLINELNLSVEKFWSTLHNPSIIKPLLDINKSLDYKAKEIFKEDFEETKVIKAKAAKFENVEETLKKLEKENDAMRLKLSQKEAELKELEKIKERYQELKLIFDESQSKSLKLKETNKELKRKYKQLELDVMNSKNSLKALEQKIIESEKLLLTVENLEKDNKLKDSIIRKFERLNQIRPPTKQERSKSKERFANSKIKTYETEEDKFLSNAKIKTRNLSGSSSNQKDLNQQTINIENKSIFPKADKLAESLNKTQPSPNKTEQPVKKEGNHNFLEDASCRSTIRGELSKIDKEIIELQNKLKSYV